MDYETVNGTIPHIDNAIEKLKDLQGKINEELVLTDKSNQLDNIVSSVANIVDILNDAKNKMLTAASGMSAIAKEIKGG